MLRFAAALLFWLVAAAGQPAGAIEGTVADVTGSALPGVVVTVTGPGRSRRRSGPTARRSRSANTAASAWFAAVRQESTDRVQGSARNEREHLAAKFVSNRGPLDLTSYVSYDGIHEDTYQRLYGAGDFEANPRWDRLVGDWPGVPYRNQFYRPGWQTRRNNTFAYLKADWSFSDVTTLGAGAYFHRNRGRGDWLPPYIVDLVDDGGGPESELAGLAPVRGGSQLGVIRLVNPDGAAVGPEPGCTSSYIFNDYGSGGRAVDPACHPGATAVQSYRHSRYGKDRLGVTLDGEWFTTSGAAGSTLRAGVWYEDSRRDLGRDRHRMPSARRVSLRPDWTADAYWVVDAHVSFSGEALSDLLRRTDFSIVANNLLDKPDLSAITENAGWLGAPRTISMTGTISF